MNLFVGIGKVTEINVNGRVLKFTLAVQQEKPCNVPCLLFDPDDEVIKFMEQLESSRHLVWLQGRLSCYEFKKQDKTIRKIEVVTYARSIRPF